MSSPWQIPLLSTTELKTLPKIEHFSLSSGEILPLDHILDVLGVYARLSEYSAQALQVLPFYRLAAIDFLDNIECNDELRAQLSSPTGNSRAYWLVLLSLNQTYMDGPVTRYCYNTDILFLDFGCFGCYRLPWYELHPMHLYFTGLQRPPLSHCRRQNETRDSKDLATDLLVAQKLNEEMCLSWHHVDEHDSLASGEPSEVSAGSISQPCQATSSDKSNEPENLLI